MPPQANSIGPLRTLVLLFVCLLYAKALAGPGSGDQEGSWDAEASACITGPPAGVQAPTAPRRPKTLLTAAGPVVDDFHWLRDDSHSDPEVLGYLTAENAYSDASLAQLQPLAAKLAAEMEGRLNKPNDPVPVRQGAWWYYERQEEGQRFWQRYRRPAQPAQQQQQQPSAAGSNGNTISSAAGPAKQQHSAEGGSLAWNEVGPQLDAPEQVVLDPNAECEQALAGLTDSSSTPGTSGDSSGSTGSSSGNGGSNADAQHCDVYGSSVSPNGALVAFGVDVSGSEQYQLLVRHIDSGRMLLPAPLPGTSGDYEWAADSGGLFFVTRDSVTNRPWRVWFISLRSSSSSSSGSGSAAAPVLLWQEDNPAFYLSLSRSSSGGFLLLSGASEVTRQVLLLDLQQHAPPSADAWLVPAPRVHGVQQQVVGHWQSWLFLLVVSPDTPNGELLVAPVEAPQQHTVLLPHRREVELEDVRIYAHHLVLAERQLGHTTITVYCLPANSSAAALAACRYNSTAASAAEAQAAKAEAKHPQQQSQQQQAGPSGGDAASDSKPSSQPGASSSSDTAQTELVSMQSSADDPQEQPLSLSEALPLLASSTAATQPDAHHQSGTFVMIRGRAGSSDQVDQDSPTFSLLDPAVAVEQLQQQQQQHQQHKRQQQEAKGRFSSNRRQAAAVRPASKGLPASAQPQKQEQQRSAGTGSVSGGKHAAAAKPSVKPSVKPSAGRAANAGGTAKAAVKSGKAGSSSSSTKRANARAAAVQPAAQAHHPARPPVLSPENSWQVAFEEDAYSVSILDSGDWAAPLLRLSYTSFTTPHTVLDIHMFTQRRVVRSVAAVGGGFRPSDYRSYRLWASAGDGVEVPLSLVYRLDSFTRNGRNPALLMVYGAYGTKYDPEWDSRLLSLLDRGWVLGIAHVRGGGELGYAWHAAGRLEHKPNSFSDLAAAAATMIAHNLTSPGRLAVWGRSAGGLTAAGAINVEPHLFNAALLDVPFLDVVGDLVDAGLPLTVKEWDEWGHPLTNASQAAVIASYSPVHNVKKGASYPHMLVTAGLMDKRVGYWEAAKWVAQLRAAGAGSGSGTDGTEEQHLERLHGDVAGSGSSDSVAAAAAAALDAGGVSASSSRHRRHGSHQALLLVTDMSGGHFSTGGSGSSTDDAALKYAFLIATLPSCGSAAGLTGPDVQRARQPQQLRGMVSLVGDSGSGVKAVLSLLPVPLQRLLVGLAGLLVTAGLMSVLWQASRVWWPAGINPAVIQATLDLAASGSTPHSKHGACGGSSSCKLSSGPSKQGREVSRRTSTASTAAAAAAASPVSDWHLQQRLSVSIGESTPLLLGACLSPGPASARHALSPGRLDACLRGSPAGAGGLPAAHGSAATGYHHQQQQQQAALVFGGLMDDWLLELTSAVPDAVGRTQQQHHTGQLQQYPSSPVSTGSHHQQQQLPPLHNHHSSTSSSSTVQRPLSFAERRSSQTGNGM